MQTHAVNGLEPVIRPNLDRTIRTLKDRRAGLCKKCVSFAAAAVVFAVAGVLVLVSANAFLRDGSLPAAAIAAALLSVAAALAVAAAIFTTKIAAIDRPLKRYRDIRAGLENAGFIYGNHREFFGKFYVFREQDGGGAAVTDLKHPTAPFIADASDALTLRLDGKLVFVGRVGEVAPSARDFLVHPDYRYRVKSKPVYENAELRILPRYGEPFCFAFPFRNAERKQFVSFSSYIC